MIKIGITLRTITNDINLNIDKVPTSIIKIISNLGAYPIIIPNIKDISYYLKLCDGFIIPGGNCWSDNDIKMLEYALENDLPILGICAGMQLIANNNSFIDNTVKIKNDNHYSINTYVHQININDGILKKIINNDRIFVNSRHHSTVVNDEKFVIEAISDDGIIEAISLPNYKFVLGLQWHPEDINDNNSKNIFKYFINKCK